MLNFVKNDAHEEQLVSYMHQQFQKGGQLEGFVRLIGQRFQILEDLCWAVMAAISLQDATDGQLDLIGSEYNVPRPISGPAATDDESYRVLIFAKIAEIVSYGTIPDVYNILRALQVGEPWIKPVYPASMTINYQPNTLIGDCGCMKKIIESATPPISLDITEHSDQAFGFLGDVTAYGFNTGELGETA